MPFVKDVTAELSGPHSGTLICGEFQTRFRREAGIYDDEGQPLPFSDVASNELTSFPADNITTPQGPRIVKEPTLFAGLVLEQFGHIITNSLGRLWAIDQLPPEVRLVFLPKRRAARKFYPSLQPILDLLGIKNAFIITPGPMRFEQMYTAQDIFGERYGGLGTETFFNWLDSKIPADGPIDPEKKIYVTRGRLGANVGRYACEDHLERLLAAQNYEIFAPEQHDLSTQIKTYQTAQKLIFAEGSALHLFSLVRRPAQIMAVIKRRTDLPDLIVAQMRSRPGSDFTQIDAIKQVFWPPTRSDHRSVASLDFDVLKQQLLACGLIEDHASWVTPSEAEQAQSLTAGLADGQKMLDKKEHKEFNRQVRMLKAKMASKAI